MAGDELEVGIARVHMDLIQAGAVHENAVGGGGDSVGDGHIL